MKNMTMIQRGCRTLVTCESKNDIVKKGWSRSNALTYNTKPKGIISSFIVYVIFFLFIQDRNE